MYYLYRDYWRSLKDIDDFFQYAMLGGQTVWRYSQDWYYYRQSDWSTLYSYRRLDDPDWADFKEITGDIDRGRCMHRVTARYVNGQ